MAAYELAVEFVHLAAEGFEVDGGAGGHEIGRVGDRERRACCGRGGSSPPTRVATVCVARRCAAEDGVRRALSDARGTVGC
jgi:hypothetical protein